MDAVNLTKVIPSWLTQELFDKVIQAYQSDPNAKVISFNLQPALQPGQNMASAVFRAKITFTSKFSKDVKEVSMIVKTQPAIAEFPSDMVIDEALMGHLKDTVLFETEMAAYTNVLGRVQELIKSAGYKNVMCPNLIYHTMTPKPVIILEDVSVNGYDTEILTIHENFELSKLIIKYLAKFHAASFYLQDEQKIDAAAFNSTYFQFSDVMKAMSSHSYEYLTQVMTTWNGFEKLVEPVKHFKEIFLEKIMKTYSPNSGSNAWNVINHGDFLMKNMLYKMRKESEDVEDFMMLDFQFCFYASPAIDITYVLYNFVSDDDRHTRYDEILAIYHEQFVDALKKFGYLKQPPSLLDLQVEMMKNGHFQAHYLMILYPFLIFDLRTLTMEDLAGGLLNMGVKMYGNERFQKTAKKELEVYLRKGFLGN